MFSSSHSKIPGCFSTLEEYWTAAHLTTEPKSIKQSWMASSKTVLHTFNHTKALSILKDSLLEKSHWRRIVQAKICLKKTTSLACFQLWANANPSLIHLSNESWLGTHRSTAVPTKSSRNWSKNSVWQNTRSKPSRKLCWLLRLDLTTLSSAKGSTRMWEISSTKTSSDRNDLKSSLNKLNLVQIRL